jgi:hypothetical protein
MTGVRVAWDAQDQERSLFGAQTSGQVCLFDRDGHLRYCGGITIARGHVGANSGRSAIEAMLQGEASPTRSRPVFGCPLVDPDPSCCEKGSACPAQQ